MADKKISQLTAASTPLAGTEVLPIVQSSTTVKVATDDLTVKNIRSNATTGILQVAGPGAATTRVMTVPNADFTAARTDAAQTFTGDQTLGTGNLVIGTGGKGIDFSATVNPGGMTSELLNDYEEGTWTPTYTAPGATFVYANQVGRYTKLNQTIFCTCWIETAAGTVAGSGTGVGISGLPFALNTNSNIRSSGGIGVATGFAGDTPDGWVVVENQTVIYLFYRTTSNGPSLDLNANDFTSGAGNALYLWFSYRAA